MEPTADGHGRVREGRGPYGELPAPAEDFGGAGVLADLATAPAEDAPRIVARYLALRAWLLSREPAAEDVLLHARTAAAEHLASTDRWPEGELLSRLPESTAPASLLEGAAELAAAAGHPAGARALRQVATRLRWAAMRPPPPSPS